MVIPVMTQQYAMLQRNLLYTGVTRGNWLDRRRPSQSRCATSRAGGVGRSWPNGCARDASAIRRVLMADSAQRAGRTCNWSERICEHTGRKAIVFIPNILSRNVDTALVLQL